MTSILAGSLLAKANGTSRNTGLMAHRPTQELGIPFKNGFIDIELFAGAGGLSIGLAAAGLPPDYLFELEKNCCATLRHNAEGSQPHISGKIRQEDVASVNWSEFQQPVRLLSGGPPCQPFSFGGKHLAERDGRNQFPATLRAVRELRPAAVLLENVPGLARPTFKPYLDYIVRQLECPSLAPRTGELWDEHDRRLQQHGHSRGYEAEYKVRCWVLSAADFGVAQARVRVVFAATRADLPAVEDLTPTHSRAALMQHQERGEYWSERDLPKRRRKEWPRRVHGNSYGISTTCMPWRTVRDALVGLPDPPLEDIGKNNHWLIPGARLYTRHSGSELDWPAKTIKAGVHGVAGGENVLLLDGRRRRYFTLREMARLQGFPDDYYFIGPRSRIIGQIGNAVPCELARVLGLQLSRPLIQLVHGQSASSDNQLQTAPHIPRQERVANT